MSVKLIAIVSDIHIPYHDTKAWSAFRKWHKDNRPEHTVILGDFLDLPAASSYPQGVGSSRELLPEIRQFVVEANVISKECKRLTIVSGNHEARFNKKIVEPVAQHVDGLIGLSLEEQCRFHGLVKSIEWFNESANWRGLQIGQFLLRHGHHQSGRFGSDSPARTALLKGMFQSAVFGHHHVIQMHVASNPHKGTSIAIANGHFQDLNTVEYSLNNTWTHGFTILSLDTKTNVATPYPVVIQDGRFTYGRKTYSG